MSVGKNAEELRKAVEILLKSQVGYEVRQLGKQACGRLNDGILRTAVGGGNVVRPGTRSLQQQQELSAFDWLERMKVMGVGVETFTKLIAGGVFPDCLGYGGYEVTEKEVHQHSRTAVHSSAVPNSSTVVNDITPEEEAFLLKSAKEVGVTVPKFSKQKPSSSIHKKLVHEEHELKLPKDYFVELSSPEERMKMSKESRVPSSRISRLSNFGMLAVGLGMGAASEVTRRALGISQTTTEGVRSNPFLTSKNAERIVATLCRVRGAALKIGQMLSIQDEELVPPYLLQIFERVRQSADFMPISQVYTQLERELGVDWRSKLKAFEDKPFAAASIGQVHRAVSLDGKTLAIKIQYPGVAESIDSDINNLVSILNFGNLFPKGMFLDNFIVVARRELKDECDYGREARALTVFRGLLSDLPDYYVPKVYPELSTKRVITTEYVEGKPIDLCVNEPQEVRDYISGKFIELCLREIFIWRFMQTDPNWSNFLFGKHPETGEPRIILLDFGASRSYSKIFVDRYMRIIRSAYEGDVDKVLEHSREIGFLTGYESKLMEKAHCESIMILAELLTTIKPYDFSKENVTKRIHRLIPVMLEHRLTSPPEEIYSMHRKLSGSYLIAAKLKAVVSCGALFEEIHEEYEYGHDASQLVGSIDIDKPPAPKKEEEFN